MPDVRPTTRRAFAGLASFFLIGLALPLLGPTCGGFAPGVKTFSKGSLVIPMDVCYQCTRQSADSLDTATTSCTKTGWTSAPSGNPCPQKLAQGDVLKAYGLVYELIRNDVPVYWVIDSGKQAVDAYDVAIQYNGGFPVSKLDWASGQPASPPTAAATIRYMGGPFVVDGTDASKAVAIMQAHAATFSTVNVHVANVAFQAPVSKTMAGGWSAGGAVPPKLALLNIASGNLYKRGTQTLCTSATDTSHACDATGFCLSDPKNAEPVIEGYLAKAGIGSGAAGGTSAAGAHGQIYDRLGVDDFLPSTPGDWTTTNLYRNGYQVLWVPHWLAPGSCRATATTSGTVAACACLASRLTSTEVDAVLQTIGAFNKAGNDVFAECAGLGSFEGAFSGLTSTTYTTDYADGDPSSRFQTQTGVRYNQLPNNPFPTASLEPDGTKNYGSPLLQIGDFPFKPYSGAIEDFKPADTTAADRNYQPGVTRLAGAKYASGTPSVTRDWDYFTLRPADTAPATRHGTIVYLTGHSYSGVQGNYQAAGSRLVVNTLFNLGAACTATGVACDTGHMGVCSKGVMTCDANGAQVCSPSVLPGSRAETCNGLDDDCDGLVDEDLEQGCYDGPAGTQSVGACRAGVKTCQQNADGGYGFSACTGEVVPAAEVCNGVDDDCDGTVDDGPAGGNLTQECYSGPPTTLGVGICLAGSRECSNGSWGVCSGEVTPLANPCASSESNTVGADRNCDGTLDTCGTCLSGQTRNCYDGPTDTDGVGPCHHGVQTCNALGSWGTACVGQVLPEAEICNDGISQSCKDLRYDRPPYCNACSAADAPVACWTGPATVAQGSGTVPTVFKDTAPASVCVRGHLECLDGALGNCVQQTLPGPELCNGKDDNCNGLTDDGAVCGAGFACENGVCVYEACAPEVPCQTGYDCIAGHCKLSTCGSGTLVCPAGQSCDAETGTCVDPCARITCGTGSTCAGGFCTGGACYATGCGTGEVCLQGSCVADSCSGVICPSGTFCREGDCVQSCAYRSCGGNQTCTTDGYCADDPCAGKSCAATQTCVNGACQADACLGLACGAGQVCSEGSCVDDPCTGVSCPVGQCRDGQCYAVSTPSALTGAGTTTKTGCGCGGGEGSPFAFLGLLLALPLARRRRQGGGLRGGGAALGLALLALAGAATGCKKTTTFDPAACAALTSPLATCEGEDRCVDLQTDPSHCGICSKICEAGSSCVDAVCGPTSAVAPFVSGVQPPTAGTGGLAAVKVTLSGDRFQAGATVRATSQGGTTSLTAPATVAGPTSLTADLDLSSAPAGTWTLRVVNPNQVISNGKAFGVVIPTPVIAKIVPSPDAAPGAATPAVAAGGPRTLLVQGTGLMLTSSCRITGGTVTALGLESALGADGLTCTLDATSLQPGTYELWVVNDADHLSAHAPFQVTSAQPTLTTLAPSGVRFNSGAAPVQLYGTGFDVTSKAWLSGTGLTEAALPTTLVDSTRLIASAVDLQHCPSAPCPTTDSSHQYFLQVRNGALASEKVEIVVEAQTRVVSRLSPESAWQGDLPRLTIQGSGLSGGVLEYRPPGGTFADSTSPAVAADGSSVSGLVDLVGSPAGSAPAGSWDVRLRFPSGATSASFALRVDSNQAVITATPVPAGGQAGASVPVALTVTNVRVPASGVRVRLYDPAPGATFTTDLVPGAVPAPPGGTVTAILPLQGLHTGVYALAVVNPNGATPSAPYSFTVLPGTPRLDAVACTSVKGAGGTICETATSVKQQATLVPIRLTGANFAQPDSAGNNGSTVLVTNAALSISRQVVPQASVTVTSATQIDIALDTTTAIPSDTSAYTIEVRNPGGAAISNALVGAFQILK